MVAVPGRPGLFAFSAEGRITIADVTSDRILKTIDSGIGDLDQIVLSGDGRTLAACDPKNKALRLFDVESGDLLRTVDLARKYIGAMALNHDGSRLAVSVGQRDMVPEVRLVDTRDSRVLWRFKQYVKDLAFHPDGSRLFLRGSGTWRHTAIVRTGDGSVISRFDVYPSSQALSGDGKVLAIGSSSGEVFLLDSATGAKLESGRIHTGAVYQMAWTKDGRLLTAGSSGEFNDTRWVFRILDAAHLSPVETLFGLPHGEPTPWSLNPESGELLTTENPPRLWHLAVGRELVKTTHAVSEQAWSGCFVTDTMLLARTEFFLGRYDLSIPARTMTLVEKLPKGFVVAANHWPSQTYAYARRTGLDGETGFKIFSIQNGQPAETLSHPLPVPIGNMAFNAAGDRLVIVQNKNNIPGPIGVFDARAGTSLLNVDGAFMSAVFSGSSGDIVAIESRSRAAGAVDERIVLLDGRTGAVLRSVRHDFQLSDLALSPDRRWVAVGGADERVHLYDAGTLQEKTSFRVHDGDVTAVAFHPAAPIIATASADLTVKLWDYNTARQITHFAGLGGTPVLLAFSPTGRLLAVDGQERTTRVFDVAAYCDSATAPLPKPVR